MLVDLALTSLRLDLACALCPQTAYHASEQATSSYLVPSYPPLASSPPTCHRLPSTAAARHDERQRGQVTSSRVTALTTAVRASASSRTCTSTTPGPSQAPVDDDSKPDHLAESRRESAAQIEHEHFHGATPSSPTPGPASRPARKYHQSSSCRAPRPDLSSIRPARPLRNVARRHDVLHRCARVPVPLGVIRSLRRAHDYLDLRRVPSVLATLTLDISLADYYMALFESETFRALLGWKQEQEDVQDVAVWNRDLREADERSETPRKVLVHTQLEHTVLKSWPCDPSIDSATDKASLGELFSISQLLTLSFPLLHYVATLGSNLSSAPQSQGLRAAGHKLQTDGVPLQRAFVAGPCVLEVAADHRSFVGAPAVKSILLEWVDLPVPEAVTASNGADPRQCEWQPTKARSRGVVAFGTPDSARASAGTRLAFELELGRRCGDLPQAGTSPYLPSLLDALAAASPPLEALVWRVGTPQDNLQGNGPSTSAHDWAAFTARVRSLPDELGGGSLKACGWRCGCGSLSWE